MKSIPIELQAHLDSQVNTTCLLLKITRNVGAFGAALPPLGVTTLDQAVTYDDGDGAITYSAMAGFIPSNLSTTGDMGVDNAEAEILVPAFDLGPVVEADINAGRYDSAPFVLYRVNYNDLTAGRHEIILSGTLGQARVVGGLSAFCELRSLTQQFKQTVCEVDSLTCRATFGDAKCGYDVSTLWENGTVSSVGAETDRIFAGTSAFATNALAPGMVQWLTGDNAGRSYEIEANTTVSGTTTVALVFPTPFPIKVGDTYKMRPDCGKQFLRDCRDTWDNVLNFRGEPYIPVGDEASLGTPGANKPGPNSGTPVSDVTVPPPEPV